MGNLVILDSGHAENVAGKQSPDGSFKEWDFNNQMQYKVKKRCEEHGLEVYLTNPKPQDQGEMGLTKRANLANDYYSKKGKPKSLFISLHANAYLNYFNEARGTETYVASNASSNSKNAANYIQDEIVNKIKSIDVNSKNRGVKVADFTVIYKVYMPSILVEYAFYTNKADLTILKNNKDDLTEAIMMGICKYFNIKYKPPIVPQPEGETYYRVVAGSYKERANAEATVKELKALGYDAFIVTYTP